MNIHDLQEAMGKVVNAVKERNINKALNVLDKLLLEEPTFVQGWNQRGSILDGVGNYFDAMLNFSQAIKLVPQSAIPYCNRGAAYLALNQYQKALDDFDAAIERDSAIAEVWNNKANTYRRQVKIAEAIPNYREAVKLNPNYADARLGLAMSLLELQQFEEGWKEFEWRFKTDQMPPRNLKQKVWWGDEAINKEHSLLIYGEQGYGDALQFCRYAKHAKKMWGGQVYVEVRLPLMRLMRDVEGIDGVVVLGEKIPVNVTRQIAMMSVPALVGTEKGFTGPYLRAAERLMGLWVPKVAELPPGLRVGICWAGQNREENVIASSIDARRSLSLSSFAQAAKTKGVMWVSLQKGGPLEQAKAPPAGMMIADFGADLYDFYDTAALISQLDLVISVDTAIVHLAAGMGKPTWMLSRFDGCWRWFGDRPDSPWYPSLKQFRQPTEGDWEPVLEQVWRGLRKFVVERKEAA